MYERLTSTAIETIHATMKTAQKGRVIARGNGRKNAIERGNSDYLSVLDA
jgi:hypothetical protein